MQVDRTGRVTSDKERLRTILLSLIPDSAPDLQVDVEWCKRDANGCNWIAALAREGRSPMNSSKTWREQLRR